MEKLMIIGMALIFMGIVFLVISAVGLALQGKSEDTEGVGVAVGGFIGPIPFGFFTSKNAFWLWLLVLAVGVGLWILARRFL